MGHWDGSGSLGWQWVTGRIVGHWDGSGTLGG